MGSTGRLALLIVLLASTSCASGVRSAQSGEEGNEQNSEQSNEEIEEAVVRPRPAPEKPPPVRTITPEELDKAMQEYQAGVEAFEWGRYADAAQYLEEAYRIAPNLNEVQEYLERTYIALGMECYTEGQPEEAITIWKKVLRIDPSDEKAKTYIARTKEEIARLPADKDP